MKKHTMFFVLALAMMFAYASAQAQQPTGGNPGMGQQPGMQSPNSPNNPNNPMNRPDMGPDTQQQNQTAQPTDNTPKVSDSDLQNAVKSKLAADPAFANIQAAVEKGKVTLEGTVNSKEDKKKAKEAVKSVAGVRGVKEHLTVSGKEAETAPKSSSASGPGMGFLSAQDAAQGNASQNTAGSIAGNSQTSANPTNATPQATTPEAGTMSQSGATPASAGGADTMTLQKQIETAIKNDPTLTDSTVSVNVSEGAIDLNGTVGNSKAKTNAERIAQSYAQNRKVNDNLQVTGAGNSDLNNGHSAINNGQPQSTPSSAGEVPKGASPQVPQQNSQTPQDQGDRTNPRL